MARCNFDSSVNISRLDVTTDGTATLEADWVIIPRDPLASVLRERGQFTAAGSVAADKDVVVLERAVLDQLAAAIGIAERR